jgi:RNA polymerase sigma-70 factor (ECF subfamily)
MLRDRKSDRSLVDGCVNRDLKSWTELIKRYSPLIAISAKRRLARYGVRVPSHDIEDITQEVFSAIWEGDKLSEIRNKDDISHWLAIVSGNKAVSYLRKKGLEIPFDALPISGEADETAIAELLPFSRNDPSAKAGESEYLKAIERAIRRLPDKERLVIKLNLFHGKRYQDIAEILHLPVGTVSCCIKRAKEKIRIFLK